MVSRGAGCLWCKVSRSSRDAVFGGCCLGRRVRPAPARDRVRRAGVRARRRRIRRVGHVRIEETAQLGQGTRVRALLGWLSHRRARMGCMGVGRVVPIRGGGATARGRERREGTAVAARRARRGPMPVVGGGSTGGHAHLSVRCSNLGEDELRRSIWSTWSGAKAMSASTAGCRSVSTAPGREIGVVVLSWRQDLCAAMGISEIGAVSSGRWRT